MVLDALGKEIIFGERYGYRLGRSADSFFTKFYSFLY